MLEGRSVSFDIINEGKNKHPNADWIWIHAASLGEFEQGRYLIERIQSNYPQYRIALSFYSPSGYEARKNYKYADIVFYLPLDTTKNAEYLVKTLNPVLAIFIKYDFWWNHLYALSKSNINTVFISAMIRPDQYFVRYKLGRIRSILQGINHYYVQTKDSKEILKSLNIDQCTISGDSRLDSILKEKKPPLAIKREILEWKSSKRCFIYGSVHVSDIPVIKAMQDLDAYHIIVPHDVDEKNINHFTSSFPSSQRYTISGFQGNIVVLDQSGLLRFLYDLADIIYIGGGFGKGIHNVLEPLIYTKPIIVGPKYEKFPEAIELIAKDAIRTISHANQAINAAKTSLERYNKYTLSLQKQYIQENSGASDIILGSLGDNQWI